ncbi:YobI family P-loop NTPase, partial [Luteibacter sp.]|uniref:YobI family P-loop NTPase n=1 Tax=Luteibacter sp. TaxID=1886636 RepID=UPI003F7D927F
MSARLYPLRYRLREARLHPLAAVAALRRRLPAGKGLDTLTPTLLDGNESEGYERELALAMADPHVRNIAITGGYGAGKSSVIRTFKEHHPGFKYASVSLATFRSEGVFTKTAEDGDDRAPIAGPPERPKSDEKKIAKLIERIEETIVQQLLYAVPATKLPRTRLKRIMQPARKQAVWVTMVLCVALIAAARLYLIAAFPPRTLAVDWLTTALLWIPASWAFVAACAVAAGLIYKVVRSLSLLNIDGWSIKGGTIESMQHSSVLHKNVDEIIYCFQNSRIDVVVIEDLDRFGIQDVFVRLREINAIINESPQIKRRVRFVYALNDELFAGNEKTKFFDVVLPVVPVINKENSHAKMIEGLASRSLDGETFAERINDQLVETVSYRVDDMRLVKNIVNELDVFARVLTKDLPLDLDKLFAIITIKNLHSVQYWQLSKRTGFLYQLITGYPTWRNGRADGIRAEIAELEQLVERKRTDVARTVSELRGMVWLQAQSHAGASDATQLNKDGVWYGLTEFRDDETFSALAAGKSTVYFAAGRSGTGGTFRLSDVLTEMDYDARFAAIETVVPEVESRIASRRIALRDNHKLSLSNALQDGYQHDYATDLAAHPLIAYFLDAGYLDEDYPDYLGHFYGHAIGREDMELVFTLRRGAECDVAAVIREPAKFLKKLRPRNLDRGRGLMAELLLYLASSYRIASQGEDAEELARILDDAPTHLERFVDVLDILIEREQDAVFLQAVYHLRSGLIESVLTSQGPNPSHVVAVLNALGLEDLERLGNAHPSIKKRIGSMTDPSTLVAQLTPSGDGWRWLKAASVRFDRLDATTTTPEIL